MKHAVRNILSLLLVNASLSCIVSCNMHDCGELNSLSPEEMLVTNEYVILGDFISIDTLIVLGNFEYLNEESKFMIVEYRFHPTKVFKGEKTNDVYLWNCESLRMKDNYSTILKFKTSEQLLVP